MDHDIYDDGPHDGICGGQGHSAEDVRESGRAVAWSALAFAVVLAAAWAWVLA